MVAKGWGRGSGKFLNGYRVSVWKDEKVLEVDDSGGLIILRERICKTGEKEFLSHVASL